MAAHSELGASGAHRWIACPGSVNLSRGVPGKTSSYAKEGTAAHDVAERALQLDIPAIRFLGEEIEVEGETFEVTEEMCLAVQDYLDRIWADIRHYNSRYEIFIEVRFDLSAIYPGMFGTCDCAVYFPDLDLLIVYDFKYGQGIAVEPDDNKQLKYYGLGALIKLNKPVQHIELVIIQPRAYHHKGPIRRWMTNLQHLQDYVQELIAAAKRTEDPNAPLHAGPHCTFCDGAGLCPEQANKALAVARSEFSDLRDSTLNLPDPQLLTPAELAYILDGADMLEDWLKAVRKKGHTFVELGTDVPTYRLVAKQGRRRWSGDEQQTAMRLKAMGLTDEQIWEFKLRSPAKVEKVTHKNTHAALADLYNKVSSGSTLVKVASGDDRPTMPPKAALEFEPVTAQYAESNTSDRVPITF